MTHGGVPVSVKDANGNEITDPNNIGLINPYLYRSYRYDRETGLYYLQSRYYSPVFGRYLNCDYTTLDAGAGLLGTNMYLYCANNPINMSDPTGKAVAGAIALQMLTPTTTAATAAVTAAKVATKSTSTTTAKKQLPTFPMEQPDVLNFNDYNISIVNNTNSLSSVPQGYVTIIDYRDRKNPDMQIVNSYQITNKDRQKEILSIMIIYNGVYPSTYSWNRDINSMVVEWDVHNWFYNNGILKKHTKDADIDSNDEFTFGL